MSTQPKTLLTPEEYLDIERKAEYKSEYYDGEMYAMAGATREHNLLVTNLIRELSQKLREKPCEVYPSDMRVRVTATTFAYPDVMVICGKPQLLDQHFDTLLNPTFIAEILSPSTEGYDRGRKFEYYRSIETLAQYLLVASDRIHVDLFTRQPNGQWLLTEAGQLDQPVELQSIGCGVLLADLYDKVDFAS